MFKFVRAVHIAWQDVLIGAMGTAFLFTIGKFLLGLYLGKASVGSAYGAAGSLVVVIVWVYYSAQIFFFGAEFTRVYSDAHAHQNQPTPEAPTTKRKRVSSFRTSSPKSRAYVDRRAPARRESIDGA